jgi:ATP-dependent Clp protease protease subunit
MNEQWYTFLGNIDSNGVTAAILAIQGVLVGQVKVDRVRFFVSSLGGDGDSAARLYYYLKALPLDVETIGFGQVDSCAILLLLAGRRRFLVEGCRVTMHDGMYTIGNQNAPLDSHEETLRLFRSMRDRNVDIIAAETRKVREEVVHAMRQATIMNAAEAKAFGLVDAVIKTLPVKGEEII